MVRHRLVVGSRIRRLHGVNDGLVPVHVHMGLLRSYVSLKRLGARRGLPEESLTALVPRFG